MTAKAPFLNMPYGGYLHRDVPSEDGEITHVGPGTPCGEYLRLFWQPVFVSDELKDLPTAIRILGEDLVVFRDGSGKVGLLELHCSHRGTSLEFGQIEERGIRCCYHAWLYDVEGKVLETPGEPAESTLKDRLYHGAYPTHEYGGLVFAYMGPREKQPAFPVFDTYDVPGYHSQPHETDTWPCNWLQAMENAMDPAHFQFLHSMPGNIGFTEDFKQLPEMDFMETPVGMVYITTRRVGDKVWVRTSDFIPPNIFQGCELAESIEERDGNGPSLIRWMVPIDDTHNLQIGFCRARDGEELALEAAFGNTVDRAYEERQRVPGDYDVLVGQRPIAVHDLEHLATTDRGVIMLRNLVRRGIRSVHSAEQPAGVTGSNGDVIPTYSREWVLSISPEPTLEEDRPLLLATGRKVVEERIKELSPL